MPIPQTTDAFAIEHSYGLASDNDSLISEYIRWKSSYTIAAGNRYAIWVRRFQHFVNKIPELLTHHDCVAFLNAIRGQFAPKSVQYAFCIVHNYLRFYFEQGRIRFPLFLIRIPRAEPESYKAVTENEYLAMLTWLEREQSRTRIRDSALLRVLHDTGMRVGELIALKIDDLENKSAVIRSEKSLKMRRVFWNDDTHDHLGRYLLERSSAHPEHGTIFVSMRSPIRLPIDRCTVARIVRTAAKQVGIARQVCPHCFRHSFIHRLAMLGVPDAIIAQLVGHSTPHTISHYTKLSRPEFEEMARRQFLK